MSEPKRNSLTSLGTNKKEKKTKELLKTVRFTLGLPESNEEACPEFHYSALLSSAERKRKAKLKSDGQVNGVDPLGEDDDERVKEIARHFEEKYGGAGKKKHGRYEDYVDLGAGYDETDPFIDNTDAYDEVVPEEMTTAHGGFYINCGALEFKEISDQSDAEELKELKTKKRLKRVIILNEEEDAEGRKVANSVQVKKPKLPAVDQKEELLKKRKLLSHDRDILKKKKKRAIDDLVKKKSVTVKDLLREKRESLDLGTASGVEVLSEQKKSSVSSAALVSKPSNTSITDIIESVVSAAREDDTSKDSASSISKSGSLITTDSEESQDVEEKERTSPNEEVKLPDHLPEDLKELLVALTRRAVESSAEGKCKFFSTEVNSMLLRVEHNCRALPCSSRQAVYGYLATFLPCTKDTLIKRAKKLLIKTEEDKMHEPMRKLKSVIDRMMPSVLENYSKECQRAAEENPQIYWELYRYYWSVEELPSPSSDSEVGECENKATVQKSKVPRRKFPFTHEVRSLLCEVVRIKLQCLELAKSRKESTDLNLRNFLETEVKPLWQPGWMKVSTLLRESREVHASAVLKPKKPAPIKKLAAIQPVSHGSVTNVTMQPVTAISQTSTASSNARMKTSLPVSITMTSVPVTSGTGSSTSHVPNTAKIKSVATADSSSVFPIGVSSNVMMRTKCSTPSQNVNSQVHVASSNAPVLSSASSYITSNVRNSPTSTNSTKLCSSQLVMPLSVPSRKKTGSDVTIAKVPSSSGKKSPSFQCEKQLPPQSGKPKLTVERISPKTLDLSCSVNRSVTVSSVPSASKAKTSSVELITTSGSGQKSVAVTSLPLMNIPDCISVTPSLPSPSNASVISTVSPPTTTTAKLKMSLQQRIHHDMSSDQTGIVTKAKKTEDDGIEVIKIIKDTRKAEGSKAAVKTGGKGDNVSVSKNEFRKMKTEISKDQVNPVSGGITACLEQPASIVPAATPCQQEKEVERLMKEEEETAAAADFLSQINESLKNFPNSTPAGIRDVYHHDERLIPCEQGASLYISPKTDSLSPPSAPSPSTHHRGNSSHGAEEKDKLSNAKGTDLKKEIEQTTAQDDEESVQMEVDRVMKELIELQGQFSAEKNRDTADSEYSSTKTKIPSITTNCNSSATASAQGQMQQSKSSRQYAESTISGLGRRPSTGSTDLSKLGYGFQDEFQKHLFQETANRQEFEDPNSYMMERNDVSLAYPQVNPMTVHSSISSRHNQNSSLEGCVAVPQSRSCSNANSATHFQKQMSVNMESYTGPPYLSRMPTSGNSFLQDIISNVFMPQSGSSQHSPPY